MLKYLLFTGFCAFSSIAAASARYQCISPNIGEEGMSVSWELNDESEVPSVIYWGGPSGARLFYEDRIEGFTFNEKEIWIRLLRTADSSTPFLDLQAVRDGDHYEGVVLWGQQLHPVTCAPQE